MNDIQGQENLTITEMLDVEELLGDNARFRQWQEDAKGLLHINNKNNDINTFNNNISNKIDKDKIRKDYEINHSFLCKDELMIRMEILDEILKYLD